MVSYYTSVFAAAVVVTGVATAYARKMNAASGVANFTPAFKRFQFQYLSVYYLMMAGDWLQGPYVYALYDSYGFSQENIAFLFVAGFGSSMFFGTFIGSLADRMGRKRFCLLYCALYIASCLTKHVRTFPVLMLGRLLGGVATSLLFSVFDAWMVFEHNKHGFDPAWMSSTFSAAAFGNSMVAICAGMVAQMAADSKPLEPINEGGDVMWGGFCAPFDLAICILLVGGVALQSTWSENYGGSPPADLTTVAEGDAEAPLLPLPQSVSDKKTGEDEDASADSAFVSSASGSGSGSSELTLANLMDLRGLKRAVELMRNDGDILICGLLQSLFEGSMYIFVFMWTPALTPGGGGHGGEDKEDGAEPPPYGQMFATFMLCCMCGSSIYSILSKIYSAEELLLRVFAVAAMALSVPFFLAEDPNAAYAAFLLFEVCVGVYFPSMGTMKSGIVPEESRAALYNLFRVPLNVIVLGVLLSDMRTTTAFGWSTCFLASGCALQFHLMGRLKASKAESSKTLAETEGSLDDLLGKDGRGH